MVNFIAQMHAHAHIKTTTLVLPSGIDTIFLYVVIHIEHDIYVACTVFWQHQTL